MHNIFISHMINLRGLGNPFSDALLICAFFTSLLPVLFIYVNFVCNFSRNCLTLLSKFLILLSRALGTANNDFPEIKKKGQDYHKVIEDS